MVNGPDNFPGASAMSGWGLQAVTRNRQTPRAICGSHPGMQDTSHLTGQACSLPAQETPKPGEQSSPPTRRLNPLFVEWLMGLPRGWSHLCGDKG